MVGKIEAMRPKLLIEGLATFFLCLACALVQGVLAPFIIGALLLALVYLGGPVSQAHYNPAVTLSFCLRRRQAWPTGAAYVGVQCLAAVLAALIAGLYHGHTEENSEHILEALKKPVLEGWFPDMSTEFLGTFLLAFVILVVATSRRTVGNNYYGLAIAATVAGLMGVFGALSPDFNPAVSFCRNIEGCFSALNAEGSAGLAFQQEVSYLAHSTPRLLLAVAAQLAGAAVAAWAFLGIFPEER
jgi:aquaporin Z